MASKTLGPYIETAKKYIVHVEYTAAPADNKHGPAIHCRIIVDGVPIIKGSFEGLGVAYFNPTDPRGYSATEGQRIALERALKAAAYRVRMFTLLATDSFNNDNLRLMAGGTDTLRAIVATHDAGNRARYSLSKKDRKNYDSLLQGAIGSLCEAAKMTLAQKDANLRKLAKLRKLVSK